MVTIVIKQSLSKSELYEHRYMENIKELYKYSGDLMVNSSIRLFMKQKWSPFLRDLMTTFHCHLDHM